MISGPRYGLRVVCRFRGVSLARCWSSHAHCATRPTAYGATKRPRLVWLLAGRPLMAGVRLEFPILSALQRLCRRFFGCCGAVCDRSRPARASLSCSTALVGLSSGSVRGRPRPRGGDRSGVILVPPLPVPPVRSAARAAQPDVGPHPRRARPVPAPGAPRGGVGGFLGQIRGSDGGRWRRVEASSRAIIGP